MNVIVEVPAPVIEVGLKTAVTFFGRPDAVRVMAASNPPVAVLAMVEVPVAPCANVTPLGEAERLKPVPFEVPTRLLIRASPFGLPQPLARS